MADRGRYLDSDVELREVVDEDVAIFFEHQADEEASAMAAFPSRERAEHDAHWERIRAREDGFMRTIVAGGEVVGNLVSWEHDGEREVGYWIGKAHWGRGIASAALPKFLALLPRPLIAAVARHNIASIKVLERCGFIKTGEEGELDLYELSTGDR